MLRFTLIFLTLHISITNVVGQSVTTKQVEDINNSILLKVFVTTNNNNTILKADMDVSDSYIHGIANRIALQDRIGDVYQTLDVFDAGVYVKLDEYTGDGWCRVQYGNKTGYIRSEYLGVVCQANKNISEMQSKQHISMEAKLNEKWTASYKTEDTEPQKTGAIEVEFRPDGTFRYDERHPGESVSYANGTYYYMEQTGEIFVHVESGGYDWITHPATETMPPLYWGEVYSNYQFYFKITKRSDATVTVIEHISNDEGVSNTAIWEENNGAYSLIITDQSMMTERQYTFNSL